MNNNIKKLLESVKTESSYSGKSETFILDRTNYFNVGFEHLVNPTRETFSNIIFDSCSFSFCDFSFQNFENCIFLNCNIQYCSFDQTVFKNCNFINNSVAYSNIEIERI